jgi:hypothetical protein
MITPANLGKSPASLLSWLVLGIWLAYSAAMLWDMKQSSAGAMCHYAPPQQE